MHHPFGPRDTVGEHLRHVAIKRRVLLAGVIAPRLDAPPCGVVPEMNAEPRRVPFLDEPMLFVREAHRLSDRVDRGHQIPRRVVFVAPVGHEPARSGLKLEPGDVPAGITAYSNCSTSAVGQAFELRAPVFEVDAIARAIDQRLQAISARLTALGRPEEGDQLAVQREREAVLVTPEKRAARERHHAVDVRQRKLLGLPVRRNHRHRAAAYLDFPCERVAPSEAQPDVALDGGRGVRALDGEHDRPREDHVGLRDRVDPPGGQIDRVPRGGAAAAAVRRVHASATRAGSAGAGVLPAPVGVVAAVLAVCALSLALPLAAARAAPSAVAAAAEDEDARVHPGDGRNVRYRCRACHVPSSDGYGRKATAACSQAVAVSAEPHPACGRPAEPPGHASPEVQMDHPATGRSLDQAADGPHAPQVTPRPARVRPACRPAHSSPGPPIGRPHPPQTLTRPPFGSSAHKNERRPAAVGI